MTMTTFAAKWGAGPTLAATLIGGASLAATVGAFQYHAIGVTLGVLSETVDDIGPAMREGQAAVRGDAGAPPPVAGDPASSSRP